jgi:hypothetical protein
MGDVLEKSKLEQVISLGRLGWSLRRIEEATGVRRETAGGYLRLAGIALRRPGGWGYGSPSKPAIEVTTGFLLAKTPSEPTDKRSGSVSEAYRSARVANSLMGTSVMTFSVSPSFLWARSAALIRLKMIFLPSGLAPPPRSCALVPSSSERSNTKPPQQAVFSD